MGEVCEVWHTDGFSDLKIMHSGEHLCIHHSIFRNGLLMLSNLSNFYHREII